MSHLFEIDEKVPVLKLLERWAGEHNTYAVGAEPMSTSTWHVNQVVLGPECKTIEELEQVVSKIRGNLDTMLAEARVKLAASRA